MSVGLTGVMAEAGLEPKDQIFHGDGGLMNSDFGSDLKGFMYCPYKDQSDNFWKIQQWVIILDPTMFNSLLS